jgi:hypothetical protein
MRFSRPLIRETKPRSFLCCSRHQPSIVKGRLLGGRRHMIRIIQKSSYLCKDRRHIPLGRSGWDLPSEKSRRFDRIDPRLDQILRRCINVNIIRALKVFVATDLDDMHMSFNGLYARAKRILREDPQSGALFSLTTSDTIG